jgi:putative PEP-CTERM system histidine kinase
VAVVVRPAALASWLFLAGMVLLAADCLLSQLLGLEADTGTVGAWTRVAMLVKSLLPGVWLGFSLVYARGQPRETLNRWKWGLLAALLVPAGLVLGFPGEFRAGIRSEMSSVLLFAAVGKAWVIAVLLITLAILVNFEKTFRAAVGMTRWRIKYLILGLALIFGVNVYVFSQMLLFSAYHTQLAELTNVALILGCGLIGVGQVRASFGDFDIYPSRAILQGSVTVILAGVYFLIIGVLAQWAEHMGGATRFPAQALVVLLGVVGVTILLLSERVRTGLRRFISRHFRRPEHDFRKIWTEFTRRTASVLDAATLGKNAGEVIAESFHLLGVTVFRVATDPPALEWLAATERREPIAGPQVDAEALASLAKRGQPLNLEREPGAWAERLRDCCPRKFDHGGDRLAVPLVAAERLVGLLILTDRVNGIPYSHEELDLLKCIGDQLAGGLLNCALTETVLQAKELEAFQTLSTFFVHDLKNAANGLGLMLQNLPANIDDPEFRADTISGVRRTVERINQLILKLGSLRRELQLNPRPCRMDLLCSEVLDQLASKLDDKRRLLRDLPPVPLLPLDPEAMRSVVTNLVLNAHEALDGGGLIRVTTRQETRGVVLEVADTGCGMSPEFVKSLLFRPFHSTKTNGLGIGMFQCKKFIEAHGGTISVASQLGAGTCYTIFLPLVSQPLSTPPAP